MIFQRECTQCDGLGRIHSPGCNGDPDDDGIECAVCDGAGMVDVELDEEGDEI